MILTWQARGWGGGRLVEMVYVWAESVKLYIKNQLERLSK